MARNRLQNGIIDTLLRLFGHTDHRSILTKYVSDGVFNKHLEDGDQRVFKRSVECDNLIKNVLALDVAFGSQDLVVKVIQGSISHREISQHIKKEREKLDTKFRAYGYWLNRMNSLDTALDSSFDLEGAALEDVLGTDGSAGIITSSSPYALRAVRLLEKVEEDGRLSKLSPDHLVEKAWALYRLGLHSQAVELAREATSLDPTNPEGWMLLAVESQSKQHEALADASHYALEQENADPVSSHESWAEEMHSDAVSEYFIAKRDEKEILFSAIRYWPKDPDSRRSEYKLSARREEIRDMCVEWLFTLLKPSNNYAGRVDLCKAYEINGLGPEFKLREALNSYKSHRNDDYPAHGLTPVEIEVAELICNEFDQGRGWMFSPLKPSSYKLQLMLLHVRYALKIEGYEQARQWFAENSSHLGSKNAMLFIRQYDLFNALFTHLSSTGFDALRQQLKSLTLKLVDDQQDERALIELNFLRKTYDRSFARDQFLECMLTAREAKQLSADMGDRAPKDYTCNPGGVKSNKLTTKFWHSLELIAAIELSIDPENFAAVKETLLSVAEPEMYFADEREYMISSYDYDDDTVWYDAPYGCFILEHSAWSDAINRLVDTRLLNEEELSHARQITSQLDAMYDDDLS